MTADTLLGNRLKTTGELHEDTLVNGLAHGGTLGDGLLATATTDADSIMIGLANKNDHHFMAHFLFVLVNSLFKKQ